MSKFRFLEKGMVVETEAGYIIVNDIINKLIYCTEYTTDFNEEDEEIEATEKRVLTKSELEAIQYKGQGAVGEKIKFMFK